MCIELEGASATEGLELCEGAGARFGEVRFGRMPRSFSRHEEISARLEKRKEEKIKLDSRCCESSLSTSSHYKSHPRFQTRFVPAVLASKHGLCPPVL